MSIKKVKPKPGQESVWDYPRPPRLEKVQEHLRIVFNGQVIVDTNQAFRVLETSHPPTYYLPISDFKTGVLQPVERRSFCEYKGLAVYFDIELDGKSADECAWSYPEAKGDYAQIRDCVSVYAHTMAACYVSDELVRPQEGDFYGGWITSKIVGPFKGAIATWGW